MKPIVPCKSIQLPTLDQLHIFDKVMGYIDNIGWMEFCSLNLEPYDELTGEFYPTFHFAKPPLLTPNSPAVVHYRIMGKEFDLSISEFNMALGFYNSTYLITAEYLDSYCDFPSDFMLFLSLSSG